MTHFASTLHLDRAAIKALKVTDLYSLHRVIYSLYEDVRGDLEKNSSQHSGFQFSDQGGDFSGRTILMISDREPASCVSGRDGKSYGEVRTKKIPDTFLTNREYRFKIIINPTRRDSKSKKRLPVKGREAIAKWFASGAIKNWGFSVDNDTLQVEKVELKQFYDKKKNKVTVSQAHISGFLEVVDQLQFSESFKKGIGRSRSFGCGLLQIVPV